ncbi:RHH-type rel operon transcriptional repressor/antitoxin RelB [Rhizobium aquaticum]|uniref:RHH-type rel operon transcriptional repressor/antitoxin RelB n=1 Tax=Rhizobium aquaticum TaxID=1549636 RepID=A0ABV2J631_9HYPH
MNKRVIIEMPEEIHDLMEAEAARGGMKPDAYVLDLIVERLEDLHDIALAEAALERIRSGESKVVSGEEFWRGLDD